MVDATQVRLVGQADGSASTLPALPRPEILRAMFTIAGGESINLNELQEIRDGRQRPRTP